MNVEIGANSLQLNNWTFVAGSSTITVYDWFKDFSKKNLQFISIQRVSAAFAIYAPSLDFINSIAYSAPLTAPTIITTSGGSVTAGIHYYKSTFILGSSETVLSPVSSSVDNTTNKTNTVTLPFGPTGTTQRGLYRTNAGADPVTGTYYFIGYIADNTTATYVDTSADNTTTAAPTTSNCYDITYVTAAVLAAGDIPMVYANANDDTRDDNLNGLKTLPQYMTDLPPFDPEQTISDSNQASGTYYYELPVANCKNFLFYGSFADNTGFIVRLYKTLDSTIAVTATNATPSTGWLDCTLSKFGIPPLTGTSTTFFTNLNQFTISDMPDRYMLGVFVGSSTNTINLFTRKY